MQLQEGGMLAVCRFDRCAVAEVTTWPRTVLEVQTKFLWNQATKRLCGRGSG